MNVSEPVQRRGLQVQALCRAFLPVGRQTLQRQLVPRIPAGPDTPAPTYIVHQAKQFAQAAADRKKSPAERLDLQSASLYRLADVHGP